LVTRVTDRGPGSELAAAISTDSRRRLTSRVARLRASHSYRFVLALVAATFLFASIAGDAVWTTGVLLALESVLLAVAVWTSGLARFGSNGLIAMVVGTTLLAIAVPLVDDRQLTGAAGLLSGVFVVATILAIGIGVIDQDEVNAHSITGAVCVYLLFGLLFLFLYSGVALIGDGSFFTSGTDGTRALRLYFSFVTLATLGYGDYTPAGDFGHTLAILEALIGQLYLVTVLALLVSRLRRD
jgi:hypothetical protein